MLSMELGTKKIEQILSAAMWIALQTGRSPVQQPADADSPLTDFSTLNMEAIRSSETSVNPGSTQRHIPEDDILQIKTRL
jgi:hypothetical protein